MSIDVQTLIRNTCLYRGGEFNVLMAMADCANTADGTGIYPGIDLLAANARQSVRQCQDNIKRLRVDRVVVQLDRHGQDLEPEVQATGGRHVTTEYRIDLERVQELQGLHEAEKGTCDFCRARDIRRERAAKRVRFSARKGAVSNTKGATSDEKGAVSSAHIEEPLEPSEEPSQTPVRAREVDAPQDRKQKPSDGFNRLWTEIANHWPGDHRANKAATERAWAILASAGELRSPGDMVAAARTEGRARQAAIDDASKRKGDRPKHVKSPSGWLLDRCFVGLIDEPVKSAAASPATPKTFDELVDAARVVIAPEFVEKLRRTGLPDQSIAEWFADAEFVEDGFILRAGTRFKASEIARRFGKQVGAVFGVAPEYVNYEFRKERAA